MRINEWGFLPREGTKAELGGEFRVEQGNVGFGGGGGLRRRRRRRSRKWFSEDSGDGPQEVVVGVGRVCIQ